MKNSEHTEARDGLLPFGPDNVAFPPSIQKYKPFKHI